MGYIIATASQKGGVGKSTLCRMIAREAAINGLTGKIADFDVRQSTTTPWTERRMQNGVSDFWSLSSCRSPDAGAAVRPRSTRVKTPRAFGEERRSPSGRRRPPGLPA